MRIGVVGGGAIGLLTAGYLSKHFPVTLYVRRQDQKEKLQSEGFEIIGGPGRISSMTFKTSDDIWSEELIIIAVKQPAIPELLSKHPKAFVPGQSLLFLQNGASHLDIIDDLKYDNIFIGLVEHGAGRTSDNTIVQRGFGMIKVGVVRGSANVIKSLINNEDFPFTIVGDWKRALDEKLLINSVINPLTGIFRVQNGALISNPHYMQMMKTVFVEVMKVLELPDINKEWNHLINVCQNTKDNRSSMLQDIVGHRRTEVDAILGSILQLAKKKNVSVPILQFLYESIKAIEHNPYQAPIVT